MDYVTCEIVWLSLLRELGIAHSKLALLYCDSQVALHVAKCLPNFFMRGPRHIEIDWYAVREKLQVGVIRTVLVSTHYQLIDVLTKAQHLIFINYLGR